MPQKLPDGEKKKRKKLKNDIWRKTPEGREKVKGQSRRWRHSFRGRYAALLHKDTKKSFSSTITLEEFIVISSKPCSYCGEKLAKQFDIDNPNIKTGKTGGHLDRRSNDRGYEIDNVVSCCWVCNSFRNEFLTPEETKAAAMAVIAYRENQENLARAIKGGQVEKRASFLGGCG